MQYRLVSGLGLFVMMFLAWLMSSRKSLFPWRVVIGGLGLQFILAALILRTQGGNWFFKQIEIGFQKLLEFVDAGCAFVFGNAFRDHYFAFKVLPTIIFFSAFMSILYYFGIIQFIVGVFARLMQHTLGTSGAETLAAAANVFVGQTEAPLVIRPYVVSMTNSELNALMVGGFATIAGGVLAAFAEMGISPQHLLSASVISAPAALLIAKIMLPETEESKTMGEVKVAVEEKAGNVVEAVANGTAGGLLLALNVGAMLITFLALIALLDAILGSIGAQFGFVNAQGLPTWSLSAGLGYAFAPLAWTMGIEWKDCQAAGQLLGIKMAANEFVAYQQLAQWIKTGQSGMSERSIVILTYALCGFANFSSIGIQLGGIGGIAPERRGDLARLGLRAMLGGTLAAFMTACVAGILL